MQKPNEIPNPALPYTCEITLQILGSYSTAVTPCEHVDPCRVKLIVNLFNHLRSAGCLETRA